MTSVIARVSKPETGSLFIMVGGLVARLGADDVA